MAAESKIDPMHQFAISKIADLNIAGYDISFTTSALWMLIVLGALWVFMLGGMKRQLVPGRWQAMVEGVTGFVDNMVSTSIGPEGRKFMPWVFSIFMFILFANLMGMMPFAIAGVHPFTVTSQFTVTGLLAIVSFSIVLIVGFWRHGFHFFSLFVPHGTPLVLLPLIFLVELISFMVRPFSLALRLFVAMIAGHILVEVFGNFVVSGLNAGGAGTAISLLSFVFIAGVLALELLVAAIQAYVFALLTSLYINDAVNLH
ncbi:F0F1 ATP synthase subunit A [Sphingosinicella ginsenosidimutans]|uniref:ATP synthase subunit a n=1 Tax=Allosphingosinicella ginsenosidimutans TaxID=1176539 RepID=A0A5C6TRE5_9SPHN|nr:F0F1 ATP synthase subunit A [Sphingosinicella ginsenosidimutans]TXC62288.1 F0F1 ATP synthase subunit A [Sphingosinicella ginsenosidimutans]